MPNRRARILIGALTGVAVALGALTCVFLPRSPPTPAAPPAPAGTREARWRQDLRYLAAELPRMHGNLFWKLERADFAAAVAALDARVGELDDDQLAVGVARIVALADDAHSKAWIGKRRLPLSLYEFEDGLHVTAVGPGLERALRCRVLRIGDTDVDEALRRASALVPSEGNASWVRREVPDLLAQADVLHGLELTPSSDRARFSLRAPDGTESELELEPLAPGQSVKWVSGLPESVPAYRKRPRIAYEFEVWEDARALYFAFNSCSELPDKPFAAFAKELFAAWDSRRLERLIVDLRYNEGGDSAVIRPFLAGLRARPELDRKERVFVLIGRRTFSSGSLNAREFRDAGRATLVGEPTGGNPSSPFRESMQFKLPNSQLGIGLTWRFVGRSAGGSAVEPDVRVGVTSADFFAGRDLAVDAALGR